MKKILKIIALVMVVAAFIGWGIRVYDVNQQYQRTTEEYKYGEQYTKDDWTVTSLGGTVMTTREFSEFSGISNVSESSLYELVLKLDLEYTGEKEITTDEIYNLLFAGGFRVGSWFNGVDVYTVQDMNQDAINEIVENGKGTVYIVTDVQASRRSKQYYDNCTEKPFYYELTSYPVSVHFLVSGLRKEGETEQ